MGRLKQTALKGRDAERTAARIGDLMAQGVDVFCWCNRCGHNATVGCEKLVAELGPAYPVPEIGARLRCSGCGSKDIATRPNWRSLGQVARHD